VLALQSIRGSEFLGNPFEYELRLASEDPSLQLTELLGRPLGVHIELDGGERRHLHGYVVEADFADARRPAAAYRIVMRPWLWLLGYSRNCRIFQNRSAPEILQDVFADYDFANVDDLLDEEYPKESYVVQYRESDLHFVSRVMERAGIYYYFRHGAAAHTLVLCDSPGVHHRAPGCERLPYHPENDHRNALDAYVDRFHLSQRVTPGAVVLHDFDFEKPNADLLSKMAAPKGHPHAGFSVYDYPGKYCARGEGETHARVLLEGNQKGHEQVSGHTNARRFATGGLFELTHHPRDDQNREYLIVGTRSALENHDTETAAGAARSTFSCEFHAIDARIPFRSTPVTRKPVVEGPQTAIVVGKSGEEIWTDRYGRVKVQFHWDRVGGRDENSSCWVRVAQAWAGSNWGAVNIPRIGQEVIVDFLEGDPDRPIVTGRVYNASNMPPYALPGNQTQSGVKSRSTKGGGVANANEIRFEDRKGGEEFFVQAEKDLNTVVKNDETRKVGADRTTRIGVDESLAVGRNRDASVKGDDSVSVHGSQHVTIGGSRDQEVGAAETVVVVGAQSIEVGAQSLTVGGARSKTVEGSESISIGGDATVQIDGARSETVKKDETLRIDGARTVTIGKKATVSIQEQLVIDVGKEIVIRTGEASLTLKKNGDIVLKGKNLISDASGKVSVKAGSDVVLKGSKVTHN
jgi:type VI secretion system secreted protein VgrG